MSVYQSSRLCWPAGFGQPRLARSKSENDAKLRDLRHHFLAKKKNTYQGTSDRSANPRPRYYNSALYPRTFLLNLHFNTMTMKHLFLLFLTVSLQQISYGFLQVSTPRKHGGNLPPTASSTIMMAASTLVQRSNLKDGDQAMKEQDSLVAIPPRPLEQNWWPVVALTALDSSRPNAIKVLGKDLVIFKSDSTLEDDDSSSWTVLDDRCSHRFAPLSEGRVIPLSSNQNSEQEEEIENCSSGDGGSCGIQCAYHGWEFDSTGTCAKVPQDPSKTNKARSIQTYPCRVAAGMVWIWSDPDTYSTIGRDIALPINPLLQKVVEQFGPASCYMRDLPYGMEILGEPRSTLDLF